MVKKQKSTSNLIIAGTVQIGVPPKMLNYTKTGRKSVINTLTKTGKVSIRNKKPVIRFSNNDSTISENNNRTLINSSGTTERLYRLEKDENMYKMVSGITFKQKNKLEDEINKLNTRTKEGKEKKKILEDKLKDMMSLHEKNNNLKWTTTTKSRDEKSKLMG